MDYEEGSGKDYYNFDANHSLNNVWQVQEVLHV